MCRCTAIKASIPTCTKLNQYRLRNGYVFFPVHHASTALTQHYASLQANGKRKREEGIILGQTESETQLIMDDKYDESKKQNNPET